MSAPVTWQNRERFKKKLAKLPPTVAEAARSGLEDRAKEVVDAMKRLAPVRSGALRDSITYTMPEAGAANDSRVTVSAGNRRAFYAPFVEYGTQKTRAHPFFWPVWRAFKRSGKAKVTRRVNTAIKKLTASNG